MFLFIRFIKSKKGFSLQKCYIFQMVSKSVSFYFHVFCKMTKVNNIKIIYESFWYIFKRKVWKIYSKHIFHRIKFIHNIYLLVCASDSWYIMHFFLLFCVTITLVNDANLLFLFSSLYHDISYQWFFLHSN